MKNVLILITFLFTFISQGVCQRDFIINKGDTIFGEIRLKEATRASRLTITTEKGIRSVYTPNEVQYFKYRGTPYKRVIAPTSFENKSSISSNEQPNISKQYFAKQIVEGAAGLLILKEYGVQDRFILEFKDTLIFLPPSNISNIDRMSPGGINQITNARYFAILKSLFWECKAVLEKVYEANYNEKSLKELVAAYNSTCTSQKFTSYEDTKKKKRNINGFLLRASLNISNFDFNKGDIIPANLYELGQINYSNQSSFSFGGGYIFMRSEESVTSFLAELTYTKISFDEELVTRTNLNNIKAGFNFRLHPFSMKRFFPVVKIGGFGILFTDAEDTYIELKNQNVGNTFEGVPVYTKDDYNSPIIGISLGFGLFYLTNLNRELGIEFIYDTWGTQVVKNISNTFTSYGLLFTYKFRGKK